MIVPAQPSLVILTLARSPMPSGIWEQEGEQRVKPALGGGYLHVSLHYGRLADVLERNVPPLHRQVHHRRGVHQAITKLVVELKRGINQTICVRCTTCLPTALVVQPGSDTSGPGVEVITTRYCMSRHVSWRFASRARAHTAAARGGRRRW